MQKMEEVRSRRDLIKGGLAAVGGSFFVPLFNRFQKPKHAPEQEPLKNMVVYMWSGALTSTSIKINVRIQQPGKIQLAYQPEDGEQFLSEPLEIGHERSEDDYIGTIQLTDLEPDIAYKYWVMIDDVLYNQPGKFKTPKTAQIGRAHV